jgi:hypothetical protein
LFAVSAVPGEGQVMVVGLSSASSSLLAHGERLSVIGAIFLAMAGAAFLSSRSRAASGPYGRRGAVKMAVVFSPVLILVGVVMMIAAVI